jgi:hypothetical protein
MNQDAREELKTVWDTTSLFVGFLSGFLSGAFFGIAASVLWVVLL